MVKNIAMIVLNKEAIKDMCNKHGLKLKKVMEVMSVSRSQFENMTYMKYHGGRLLPVAKIKEKHLKAIEGLFLCNREEFTLNCKDL